MPIYALDDQAPILPSSDEVWIAPDAHVIGKVRLGRDVGVWFGAVLRGDNEWLDIGERTNIQEGALLHTDPGYPLVIGSGVTIGHHAIVHGCSVGDNSLIGMGAIILNGAKIGANCLVGAGAVVTERKEFPDGTLIVGAPAKAVRTLGESGVASLRESALDYTAKRRRYVSGLKQVGISTEQERM
jgi:carbonic anhydrase/acetyltransferase-like protein (isoleucine patch superfamily)